MSDTQPAASSAERRVPLIGWVALVSLLAVLNYSSRATSGKPPANEVYRWGLAANSLVLFGIMLGVVLVLAGPHRRRVLALRRPNSWALAAQLMGLVTIGVWVLSAILSPLLHPGREQGLTPSGWEPAHAGAFVANFIVIVCVAPFVEELTFRGLGYSVLRPFGRWTAIALVSVAFGLAHGLVYGLPILVLFGSALAYMRDRTDSVFPGMLVHAAYNALALILAVTS